MPAPRRVEVGGVADQQHPPGAVGVGEQHPRHPRVGRDHLDVDRLPDEGVHERYRVDVGGVAHWPWRVEAAEREVPRGAWAATDAILDGARPTAENAFKVTLVARTLHSVLLEAKG